MRRRLTYANVTATLALFFAISGGALAAKHYLINSTKQINPKVLKALKAPGPAGPAGLQGKEGAPGKEGLPGKEGKEGKAGPVVLGEITEVVGGEVEITKGKTAEAKVECPAGSRAISGGYEYTIGPSQQGPYTVSSFATRERKGWSLEVGNPTANTETMHAFVVAYCVKEKVAIAG